LDCTNHAGTAAVGTCTGCAEPFCAHCLVTLKGSAYCAACKKMALPPGAMAMESAACAQANEAFKYAIMSFFCFGFIIGPIAISKAIDARSQIAADPTLTGRGRANAAIFLGASALALWALGMFQKVTK